MNKRQAMAVALGFVAADLSATLSTEAWGDQGLLDEFSEADQQRVLDAAADLLAGFYRRLARAEGAPQLVYPITICEGETPDDCDASSSDGRCDTCGKAKP